MFLFQDGPTLKSEHKNNTVLQNNFISFISVRTRVLRPFVGSRLHFPKDSSASGAEIPVQTNGVVLRCMLGYKVFSSCASTYAFNSFLLPPAPDVLP